MQKFFSKLTPESRGHLVGLIQQIEAEAVGRSTPTALRLPSPRRSLMTLRRKFRMLRPYARAEVKNYASYLRRCQSVHIEMPRTRARHKVSWWSPTPQWVVIEALKLADLSSSDVLFDLGCGDGRVVADAVRFFGAKAVGFDIDAARIVQARRRVRQGQFGGRASIRRQSILAVPDLYKATVVYLYLTQKALSRIVPILKQRCRKGTRVVSVDSWIPRWPAGKALSVRGNAYKWRIGVWYV